MRLHYLVVDDLNADTEELARLRDAGQRAMGDGDTFEVDVIPIGPGYFYESAVGSAMAVPGILDAVITHQGGADAFLLGCLTDPGLWAARCVSDVPVIGAGEAAAALVRLVARRFGVVTIVDTAVPELERLLRGGGFWEDCVGITTIEMTFDHVGRDPDEAFARVVREGRALVDAGAEAVILGCLSFGFVPMAERVSAALNGLPVVDPVRAGIAAARVHETLRTGISERAAPRLEDPGDLRGYLDRLREASDEAGLHGWTATNSTAST